jgi:hypothetical protein
MIGDYPRRQRRAAQLKANQRALIERRATLAETFRAKIIEELGSGNDSVVRIALIESAVSAYLEITEISASYRRGKANQSALTRLGLARGQLARTLRMLGLGEPDTDEPTSAPTLESIASEYDAQGGRGA